MIELIGTARDGKAGALLETDDGIVYVSGMQGWPDGVVGEQVRVFGRLARERLAPEATVSADGAISQGVMAGSPEDAVVHPSDWSLVGAGEHIEPGPWQIEVADGSGNLTRIWRAPRQHILFSYDPVTPAMSSSGTYSGGDPADGELTDRKALALWMELRRLAADQARHVDDRAKGTTAVRVLTVTGEQSFIVKRGAEGLAELLTGMRR